MVNAVDMAKRALVKLLKELAVLYSLTLGVTRDSPDPAVRTAYRKVSVKTHPDHGGDADHQRQLNAAYSTWETAANEKQKHRRPGATQTRLRLFFLSRGAQSPAFASSLRRSC